MILLILALILIAYFGIGYAVWRVTRGRGGPTRLAILIAVMVGVPYLAWTIFYPSSTLRAKITIDVETPEGLKTGSSVHEVVFSLEPCPLCNTSGPKFRRHVRGEAVVVDLGERGTLFALLNGGSENYPEADPVTPFILEKQFGPKEDQNWRGAEAVRVLRRASGQADIPQNLLPFMVRFRDLNDPKSVQRVDPNNLEASFGLGVKLVKATIEITGDRVTTGIERHLTWLPNFYDKRLDGDRTGYSGAENKLANSLSSGDFKSSRD